MKNTILCLTAAILFSSCSLTERRYMSGYSVNWGHKAPKTIVNKTPVISKSISAPLQPITTNNLTTIASPEVKWTLPARLKQVSVNHPKKIVSNQVGAISVAPKSNTTDITPPAKDKPQFFTGDEQEDDNARRCLTHGLLAFGCPVAAFLIMFGIGLSVGVSLLSVPAYAFIIFLLGCVLGMVFAVTAIIDGIQALHEINASPDVYTGKGDVITGMIFAVLLPIALIASYFIVQYYK